MADIMEYKEMATHILVAIIESQIREVVGDRQ